MAQTKIIVDSNSYFRLAQNIHPLLWIKSFNSGFTIRIRRMRDGERNSKGSFHGMPRKVIDPR